MTPPPCTTTNDASTPLVNWRAGSQEYLYLKESEYQNASNLAIIRRLTHHRQPKSFFFKMPYANESMLNFAAREARKMWPFVAGFAVVTAGVVYVTGNITEEEKKKSKFLHPGH